MDALGVPAGLVGGLAIAGLLVAVLAAAVTATTCPGSTAWPPGANRSRWYRSVCPKEQKIAGVCAGLAADAELDVARVRTLFVLGAVVTADFLGLVYIALAFILPAAGTREDKCAATVMANMLVPSN